MEIEKKPKYLLKATVDILEKSYKIAKKKEDLEVMLAISDRLMLLYSTLEELKQTKPKQSSFGFARMDDDDE